MNKEITFVVGDDWVAMYVDGIKVKEGHNLHYSHVLDALGIQYTSQDAPKTSADNEEVVYGETLGDVAIWRYTD